jgi:hypothetical protein
VRFGLYFDARVLTARGRRRQRPLRVRLHERGGHKQPHTTRAHTTGGGTRSILIALVLRDCITEYSAFPSREQFDLLHHARKLIDFETYCVRRSRVLCAQRKR